MTSKTSKTSKTETPEIDVPGAISVADLSVLLDVSPVEIVKALMRGGYMFAINDVIERDIAAVVCQLFGYVVRDTSEDKAENTSLVLDTDSEDPAELSIRCLLYTSPSPRD